MSFRFSIRRPNRSLRLRFESSEYRSCALRTKSLRSHGSILLNVSLCCSSCRRVIARAGALRQNYFQLPPSSFAARKAFLTEALSNGSYLQPKDKQEKEGPKNPFEPAGGMDTMMEGMKKQMVMMIPQTLIMGWINFFFSGFVLRKHQYSLSDFFQPFRRTSF